MTPENLLIPHYLFEVSWEVCNKVGGIYTVISSKAPSLVKKLKDNYILIGPDVWKENHKEPEFTEDKYIFRAWREKAESEGLKFRLGRWNIDQNPVVILVDFTTYFSQKDSIFAKFWEDFRLDSLNGQWDYIEPALFGYASSKIIASFYDFYLSAQDKVVAQFHEWMTGAGILFLKTNIPQISTVFTTHATVLGRCIAGNRLPLYKDLETYDSYAVAINMGVISKHSLEKISAEAADGYTTVSSITARECAHFHNKAVDVVTPNGFERSFVPSEEVCWQKRKETREKLKKVTEILTGSSAADDQTVYVLSSGRYEFHNKGIDVFIDALGKINQDNEIQKQIVAFIAVPANHGGPDNELLCKLQGAEGAPGEGGKHLTHELHDYATDPVMESIKKHQILNLPGDKVKVIFLPCYLNGNDGIFNCSYYDFLVGFDLTVFPSYYEPWGYTPLESIAFGIPTLTTILAGFGLWVNQSAGNESGCVKVVDRDDNNTDFVSGEIAEYIRTFSQKNEDELAKVGKCAIALSLEALWENLVSYYFEVYSLALNKSALRYDLYKSKMPLRIVLHPQKTQDDPVWGKVLVRPHIPQRLDNLTKLTRNLWWTWQYEAGELFSMINKVLWERSRHNPLTMFEFMSLKQFKVLEDNEAFLKKLDMVYQSFEQYMAAAEEKKGKLVAYFSMEFGLHDSMKTYSGGLGILAGDYLKQASDSNANIIGVSLLYRYGYFDQNISLLGDQIATYHPQKYSQLPLIPVRHQGENGDNNQWVKVSIAAPGRTIHAKIWRVEVGRVQLYLLDTDIEDNIPEDRNITHQLYGGNSEHRFKQELLLGVGGIRLLEKLGIKPDVYHCNEGHAAFLGVERIRKYINDKNLSFYEALEAVRSSTLFTTHTPVPAGHDRFPEDMLRTYIPHYAERLRISWESFMNLGRERDNDTEETFSMSILAAKLSSEINGVSRLHGKVTRNMFASMYHGYFPEELHIGYVTNGVHFPTWVGKRWRQLYDSVFDPDYITHQSEKHYWKKIFEVPDEKIWEIRQKQRAELIEKLKKRLVNEMTLRQENPRDIFKVSEVLNDKALTIGFARRFATYKRAHLLFKNPERLAKILNIPGQPLQFIFAGKAHPNDGAGQDLIRGIFEISRVPEFVGKVVFVENYDIELGKMLTQGVDIWLNTPTRPQEASGTSGQKAVMNGVVNFSVLDGWWAEGYRADAGWALNEKRTYSDQNAQDALDAETIYNLLEHEILPAFYHRNKSHVPEKWVEKVKNTIGLIAPEFTMQRMLEDYYRKYYQTLFKRRELICGDSYENARKLSAWKQKILRGWESIEVVSKTITDSNKKDLGLGDTFFIKIILKTNELNAEDIGMEILFGQKLNDKVEKILYYHDIHPEKMDETHVRYYFEMPANFVGVFDYAIRIFPRNHLLAHREDFNLLRWI